MPEEIMDNPEVKRAYLGDEDESVGVATSGPSGEKVA